MYWCVRCVTFGFRFKFRYSLIASYACTSWRVWRHLKLVTLNVHLYLQNLFVISAQKWIENLFGEMEWFYWLSYTFGDEDPFLNNINLHSDRWIQCYNLINIWLATWNSCHLSRNGFTLFFDIYDFNVFFFSLAYSSSVFSQRAPTDIRVQSVSTFSSLGLRSMWDQLIH